jgi:hypothetical protein
VLHLPRPANDLLPPTLVSGYERLAIASALEDARLARRARVRTALVRVLPHRRH